MSDSESTYEDKGMLSFSFQKYVKNSSDRD
jgi:hypothetical protein